MRTATCPKCRKFFQQDEPWKTLCLPCWKKANGIEDKPKRKNRTRELEMEIHRLRFQLDQLNRRPQTGGIPPDILKRLVNLCHPDKHGGSEMATKMTQWLLTQRNSK